MFLPSPFPFGVVLPKPVRSFSCNGRSTVTLVLKGGTAEANAQAINELLEGAKNAFRDIVLLNAAAALVVADKAASLKDGVTRAADAIDKGAAAAALAQARLPVRAQA